MRIGIMSDSHDNLPAIEKAVTLFNDQGVDRVIHAGDYVAPFTFKILSRLNVPLFGVFGNNDGEKNGLLKVATGVGEIHEPPAVFNHAGFPIAVVHDLEQLPQADRSDYRVIIYGHNHQYRIDEGNPVLINPGETGGWLTGRGTVALLDIETMKAEIHYL
jgi:putative phosphoesterase